MPVASQLMRPIFLLQIIFAGYTCCTSIFYMLYQLGYDNFSKPTTNFFPDEEKIAITAQCQRYYCLGHAALVSGIIIIMRYPVKSKVRIKTESVANLLLIIAVITFPLHFAFDKISGLSQFSNQFNSLSFIAGTLALAFAIPQKKLRNSVICVFLYFSNFAAALTSGFKEPIILSIMVLGIFLFPVYKKIVLFILGPALIGLFIFLPTYANTFRANAWTGTTDTEQAKQLALEAALNSDIKDTNWDFLVYRISEIDMFTEFVSSTPEKIGFYNFDLVKQSLIVLVPRAFWPSKPITEELVMQRVYAAGITSRNSTVSAKPAYIVDAYLSGGTLGVLIALFIYGVTAQWISQKCEEMFGGYLLGTALIFSGLFQIFWRGLSFEFILNNVVWGYVTILLIAKFLRMRRILEPV